MFADFVVAGTYFLRKYRSVINDLNVFPVPDGDTGTNMLFTVRQAMLAARNSHSARLSVVAAAAAHGSLMGARGNSGVIISQMFRGFAHAVRHRDFIETGDLASAMHEAVQAARRSLQKPVEGTIISVAASAAGSAFTAALSEPDFYSVLHAVVDAANKALEKTPEQLALLKEAKVVDAGGQGLVYFLEGAIRMLPGRAPYRTAFPRRPLRRTTFTATQKVEARRFCTEFIVSGAHVAPDAVRTLLSEHGESLIVAPGDGLARVHIHTDYPNMVMELAAQWGSVAQAKVDNMEDQHNVLIVEREAKPCGIVCVVPGDGFAKICKELGADVTVMEGAGKNPSVKDLLAAVNNVLAPVVYLFPNDKNVLLAAQEVVPLAKQQVIVMPTQTVADGIAALFTLLNQHIERPIDPADVMAQSAVIASGSIFKAGRDSAVGGVAVKRGDIVGALDARDGQGERILTGMDAAQVACAFVAQAQAQQGGLQSRAQQPSLQSQAQQPSLQSQARQPSLVTLYYGSARKLKDAETIAKTLGRSYPEAAIEVYYGGQAAVDYVISIER